MIKFTTFILFLFNLTGTSLVFAETVSPAAVGWGNSLVPGLGASLRGEPAQGLFEAGAEIGSYYGGTFYAKEGHFTIDGTVILPEGRNITKPVIGGVMQEFGLKYHMYNTFHHYQLASLDEGNAELEKTYDQPLYKGHWDDVLFAPFKWEQLSKPLVYAPILLSVAYVYFDYQSKLVVPRHHQSDALEDGLYGFSTSLSLPLGSSFGEEVYFRGFMQREVRQYTHSVIASIAVETAAFAVIHPPELRLPAIAGGIYFGLLTNYYGGDLEPSIAVHFWTDFVNGLFTYFLYRKAEGKYVPIATQVSIPF